MFELQMLKSKCINKIANRNINMPLQEVRKPIAIRPDLSNLVKVQNKNFQIGIVNMFKDFNEDMNKYFNENHENTKKDETIKAFEDIKIKFNN